MKRNRQTESVSAEALDRRAFFLKAGLGAGAAGAAAVALKGGEAKAELPPTEGGPAGYRESEHVKTYYKLARF